MGRNEDAERRLRQEKIELLKLKQGFISESEIIPQDIEEETHYTIPQKIGAFLDLNKGFIALGAFFLAIVVGFCVFVFSREAEDLKVLIVITEENSELKNCADKIEKALEMYCPDFDGNGKVHIGVSVADISEDAVGDVLRAQNDMLSLEMDTGYRQLIISDSGFMDYINEAYGNNTKVIMEEAPSGISLISTRFAEYIEMNTSAENIKFFIRCEMKGDSKISVEQRERALEVVKNIVENKAVSAEG